MILPSAEQIFGFAPKEALYKAVYKIPGLGDGVSFLDKSFPGAGGMMVTFVVVLFGGMIVQCVLCDPAMREVLKQHPKVNLVLNIALLGAGLALLVLI